MPDKTKKIATVLINAFMSLLPGIRIGFVHSVSIAMTLGIASVHERRDECEKPDSSSGFNKDTVIPITSAWWRTTRGEVLA